MHENLRFFFRNLIRSNLHVNQEESKENSCHIVGANFRKNLHLAVSLRIIQF